MLFDAVDLTVTAVTGNHHHFSPGGLDLGHFFSSVKYAFFIVAGGQGATAAAATELRLLCRIQIHPVFQALIHNPSGFVKKAVTEDQFRLAAVIAWIMIGGENSPVFCLVQFNPSFFDVADQKIKYGVGPEPV